ncbi:hypothetical protein PspLS_11557 [Pyricularia sp. CBS 133598]|nr:hypothetical protein PspLS_11557 [Pyricularia sp. CBS 133598]
MISGGSKRNTVSISFGYCIMHSVMYKSSGYLPSKVLDHLKRTEFSSHGAPGAQQKKDAFTGQLEPILGFYQDHQSMRGMDLLAWLRQSIYRKQRMRKLWHD